MPLYKPGATDLEFDKAKWIKRKSIQSTVLLMKGDVQFRSGTILKIRWFLYYANHSWSFWPTAIFLGPLYSLPSLGHSQAHNLTRSSVSLGMSGLELVN